MFRSARGRGGKGPPPLGGQTPPRRTPARETLYLLAWRYIFTDFYTIHYDNIKFNSEHVIRRTIERFTVVCKAAHFGNSTDSSTRAQADVGRQPKKCIETNDFRPLFESVDNKELAPSPKVTKLGGEMLGIEHIIKQKKIEHTAHSTQTTKGIKPGRASDEWERVFSMLKCMFGHLQSSSLADQVQAGLMLRYNDRKV